MKYDIDDLMALNMAGIGYIRLKNLTDYFGSFKKALQAKQSQLQKIGGIGPGLAQKISSIKEKGNLDREWLLIKKHKVTILSIFDKDYPENLKNIYDPPIVLYIKGKILSQDRIAIGLVGSRRASIYGLNICQNLSKQLANLGATIVSGLARGIDSAAHKGALVAKGRTVAVLGSGMGIVYPPENKRLADEIADRGALISEFPMKTPPLARNFPIRNRIISGLSLGVVIVEAARKSGALITASCALEQGREVFAVPGKAGATTSTGTHRLIRDGAKLVENIDDIIEELNLVNQMSGAGPNLPSPIKDKKLEGNEKKIYHILSDQAEHIDSIIDKSKLSAPEVARLLLSLEVKKLIKELPGKNFVTIN